MAVNLWGTVIVATSLSRFVALGEWYAREYLTTLSAPESNSLGKCLRRLGWWIPDDQQSPQERLVGWLFRDDVTRLDFSDGTERRRIETPAERLADAVRDLKSLAGEATIPSGSCLSVARFVRLSLIELGRNNSPLCPRWKRCGLPDESERAEMERFDYYCDFCLRFDGECLDAALSTAASGLGLPPGRLNLPGATGYPCNNEQHARQDMTRWLEDWRDVLMRAVSERKELPSGWEATDTTWPECPIQNVEHLREWLSSWLLGIHQARSSSRSSPEWYFDDAQRELRNARRATRAWGIPLSPELDDKPADSHEAERQLELLIDEFAKPASDVKTEATSEPPKPVERQAETLVIVPALSEKQYLILETMKELAALSADTRRSAEDIAVACDGKQADVNVFKPLLSGLTKKHKLTESKTGRGGGSWLNDSGVEVANRLIENRKASVSKR